jgi:hypothetical protein
MSSTASFPHPVLGNVDDMSGSFGVKAKVSIGATIQISGSYDLQNADLSKLVKDGDAIRVLRCTCFRTLFRKSYVFPKRDFEFHLRKEDVFGEVKLEPIIVAKNSIPNYSPSTMNSDYGKAKFDLAVGQVLAAGRIWRFEPETEYDPLRHIGASLIKIKPGSPADQPYEVDYEADRILIRISDAAWPNYQGIKNRVPMVIILGLVVPVLAEAIHKLGLTGSKDELGHYKWFQRLSRILAQRGISLPSSEPLQAAQQLLKCPLEKAMGDLDASLHRDPEDEE